MTCGFRDYEPWPAAAVGRWIRLFKDDGYSTKKLKDVADVNGDGLLDFVEGREYDTEYWEVYANLGDGFSDTEEKQSGTDPLDPLDFP